MEFLGVAAQVTVELLWVLRLDVVLLLLVDYVLVLRVADWAVTLPGVRLNALVVEGVPAHEVDRG